jgi:hypothetical protein
MVEGRFSMVPSRRCGLVAAEAGPLGKRSGLPVTVPVRTAVDVACGRDVTEAVVGFDALLYRRVVTSAAVARYLAARPSWPGKRRAVRLQDHGSGSAVIRPE